MGNKKRGGLGRLLVKHGLYKTDGKGNIVGFSRKGAYTLIFMVLSLGGSFGFLVWLFLEGRLASNPMRYIVSVVCGIILLGILAILDFKLHPEGD